MRLSVALVLLLGMTLLSALPAAAQIYKYTDERGQSYYVDGVQNVPERYRSRATPMGLSNSPAAPPPAPAGAPAPGGGTPGATAGR
ncbi:MAG: DUF4124 domain-containing protein, partial [Candidatus Rokuibacteriota bacterium]